MATPAAFARPLYERARNLPLPAELPAALLGLALVTPVASADGGWDATSWGWISLALAWLGAVAVLVRARVEFSRLEVVAVGSLGLFALWTLLSATWSGDAGSSVLSFERVLIYLTALVAVLATVGGGGLPRLLASVWGGGALVSSYALLTRLYPDRFPAPLALAGNRLEEPIGYWNGLGLLAALTLLSAVGVVATSRSRVVAALAGASVVPVALALYFTFSRGGYLALGVGIVVLLALEENRIRAALAMAALAGPAAVSVVHASNVASLTSRNATAAQASVDGAHLVRFVLPFLIVAAVVGLAAAEAGRRLAAPSERVRRLANLVLAGAAAAAAVAAIAVLSSHYGSPSAVVRKAWSSFTAREGGVGSNDLNQRLFSFSGTGRVDLWRVAWTDFRQHPLRGSGAGTYQRWWLQDRPTASQAVNAHNLYAETLAELGVPGLALLLGALLAPLVAAWRARRTLAVGAAGAVYAAFLVHAFVDWDWQLPGVALVAVLLGAGILATARDRAEPRTLPRRAVYATALVLLAIAAISVETLVANRAVTRTGKLASQDQTAAAIASARHARRLEPWSSEPLRLLGEAQLQSGDLAGARATFRSALAKDGDDWRLWLDLALAGASPSEKLHAAQRALALNPHSAEIAAIGGSLGLPTEPGP
ncbi:MAG TPA: O-antigen ligase family protein [Gaiellaceae bacterium]|nr:O-antigen ligase family protein [Gaiellaceae bacterium]